jgi:hypothetical protein
MVIPLHSVNGPYVRTLNMVYRGNIGDEPIVIKGKIIYSQSLHIVLHPEGE